VQWLWPTIVDLDSARSAVKSGVYAAWFVAAMNTIIAALVPFTGAFRGYDSWILVDAAVFATVAWRLSRMSRGWAVAALTIWGLEIVDKVISHASTFSILTIVVLIAFVSAVRGTFAFHRLSTPAHQAPALP
jgi:hypothetical protein